MIFGQGGRIHAVAGSLMDAGGSLSGSGPAPSTNPRFLVNQTISSITGKAELTKMVMGGRRMETLAGRGKPL